MDVGKEQRSSAQAAQSSPGALMRLSPRARERECYSGRWEPTGVAGLSLALLRPMAFAQCNRHDQAGSELEGSLA